MDDINFTNVEYNLLCSNLGKQQLKIHAIQQKAEELFNSDSIQNIDVTLLPKEFWELLNLIKEL
jgi:hypothetical protein